MTGGGSGKREVHRHGNAATAPTMPAYSAAMPSPGTVCRTSACATS